MVLTRISLCCVAGMLMLALVARQGDRRIFSVLECAVLLFLGAFATAYAGYIFSRDWSRIDTGPAPRYWRTVSGIALVWMTLAILVVLMMPCH